jgi:lysophospholipase L1-like esterase
MTTSSVAKVFLPLVALCLTAASLHAEEPTPRKERIVFLGDSITQAGADKGGYVTLVREAIQREHPNWNADIIGAGVSGNKVPDLEKRLRRDVLDKQPTLVVIYIGINDVWHSLQNKGTPIDEYEQGLRRIIQQIRDARAKVILCTPSVIGEKTDGSNRLDQMLDQYCDVSRKVAAETDSQVLDLRRSFLAHLKTHNDTNLASNVLTTDEVHLNADGNQFVAQNMRDAIERAIGKPALLRHVVMFKFKDEATPEQVQEVVEAFAALPKEIETIVDFEYGTDVSSENKADGFTHCFLVTFRSTEDRDAYLPHPAHGRFVQLVGPYVEKVLVIDYWTKH